MKNNNKYPVFMTGLFCAFLGIGTLGSVMFPKKSFSDTENRYLAQLPKFSFESLKSGKFGSEYEEYLSDQFPFRNEWIGLKTEAERLRLNKEINKVFLGKDDFLIEAHYSENIDSELYNKNIERLKEFSLMQEERLGSEHVKLMLVPSASEILINELPMYASPFSQQKIYDRLCAEGLEEMLIPVKEDFLKYDDCEDMYYRTDHHWTTKGAFRGYQSFAKAMGLKAFNEEDFDQVIVNDEFLGTVHSKLNIPIKEDSIIQYALKDSPEWKVYYDGSEEYSDSLYNYDALDTKDKYRFFLDGNHGLTRICNSDVKNGRKLIIIKDSFAHCFTPFAALHFEETVMVDLRYFNGKINQFIEDGGYTDILVLYNIPGFINDRNVSKLIWK